MSNKNSEMSLTQELAQDSVVDIDSRCDETRLTMLLKNYQAQNAVVLARQESLMQDILKHQHDLLTLCQGGREKPRPDEGSSRQGKRPRRQPAPHSESAPSVDFETPSQLPDSALGGPTRTRTDILPEGGECSPDSHAMAMDRVPSIVSSAGASSRSQETPRLSPSPTATFVDSMRSSWRTIAPSPLQDLVHRTNKHGKHSTMHLIRAHSDGFWDVLSKGTWQISFVTSSWFEAFCAIVILSNAFYMGYSTQRELDVQLVGTAIEAKEIHFSIDVAFFVWYSFELFMRLWAFGYRVYFFGDEWNWNNLDCGLVLIGAVQLVMNIQGDSDNSNVTWLRLLRLLKMTKMVRVVRAMMFFKELRVLLNCIGGGVRAFFWTLVLLMMLKYVFALIFMQGIASYLVDNPLDTLDDASRSMIDQGFASIWKSMMTLFKPVAHGGPWAKTVDFLWDVGPYYYGAFLLYMAFVSFAILKLLTGIFVQQAKDVNMRDRQHVVKETIAHHHRLVKDLTNVFANIDDDENGYITWEEFISHLQDTAVQAYLQSIEVDASDAGTLFKLLEVDGMISLDAFVHGAQRLRGQAKSSDLYVVSTELSHVTVMIELLIDYVEEKLDGKDAVGKRSARSMEERLREAWIPRHRRDKLHLQSQIQW